MAAWLPSLRRMLAWQTCSGWLAALRRAQQYHACCCTLSSMHPGLPTQPVFPIITWNFVEMSWYPGLAPACRRCPGASDVHRDEETAQDSWRATLRSDGKTLYLSMWPPAKEADRAYDHFAVSTKVSQLIWLGIRSCFVRGLNLIC